jgi:hypothetical protein
MGNYAKRDARTAESIYDFRHTEVARQLLGSDHVHTGGNCNQAVWLFCHYCGRLRLTDAAWFLEVLTPAETVEERHSKMPCLGCGRLGQLKIIHAPGTLDQMRMHLKRWQLGSDIVLAAKKERPTSLG